MKRIFMFAVVLNWMALDGTIAAGWQGDCSFPGGVTFSSGFLDRKAFFWGNPDRGIFPYFPGYHTCYLYYSPLKRKYESSYPAEIKEAGRLVIQVIPEGSAVFLNGYPLNIQKEGGPFNIGLLVGEYKIEVRKEGYRGSQKEVEIKTATTTNLKIILERED